MNPDVIQSNFDFKIVIDHLGLLVEEAYPNFKQNKVNTIRVNFADVLIDKLCDILSSQLQNISVFIVTEDDQPEDEKYIACQNVFHRVRNSKSPMLLILPPKAVDALENIVGQAGLESDFPNGIQQLLVNKLLDDLTEENKKLIQEEVVSCISYIAQKAIRIDNLMNYIVALTKFGISNENIGNFIFLFGLIPDQELAKDKTTVRQRLDVNLKSIQQLSLNGKSIYDKLSNLPERQDKLQRDLIELVSTSREVTNRFLIASRIFMQYPSLNFMHWKLSENNADAISLPSEHVTPYYDLMVGTNSPTNQYGIIGESTGGRKIALDLSGTNTISVFGVQGGGKSYTIGTISEMVLKQFSHVSELPAPLAGVIFHYSESMEYEPEFTSMIYPNDKEKELLKLKKVYGANPDNIDDVVILCPKDKLKEKKKEYPSIEVLPIAFNSQELNVQDWMFILGAVGNDANYVKQLKAIAKKHRKNLNLAAIAKDIEKSVLFTEFEKGLALQKIDFAAEYIDDNFYLCDVVKPGRLIIVDLRDEFIDKDEALGLFVIILNIFSGVKEIDGMRFNKFIVFDEAHKYMENKALTANIVTTIREMRHKGVSILIASQDPPSLPNEIIELSSVVLLHKFNSPKWLDHIKFSLTQLEILSPQDMNVLNPGDGYLWATKATERGITFKPLKISARPRVTKHGGATLQASGKK